MSRTRDDAVPAIAALSAVALSTLALSAALLGSMATPARAVTCEAAPALRLSQQGASVAAPAVQLIESRPIESTLGNPALPDAACAWIALIHSATRAIDIEQFYLSIWPGEPMDDVLAALGQAASRGVRIRLLLDARMYKTYPRVADSLAKMRGWTVRRVDYGRIAGGVQHAKFFLVDGRVSVIGSQNFDWRSLEHIHELGVVVQDERATRDFQRVFEMDWNLGDAPGVPPDTTRTAKATPSPHAAGVLPYHLPQAPGDTALVWPAWSPREFSPDTMLWDLDQLVALLDRSQHEVVLQTLTYSISSHGVTDDALDAALRRAAARGVRVRMIISDWEISSAGFADLKRLAVVPNIEVKLSTVPAWSGGYVPFARVEHLKYAVVDSMWMWIGTSNWEPSYFHSTRNLAVILKNAVLAQQARTIFETSWLAPGSEALDPARTYTPKEHGETPPAAAKKFGG